MGCVVSVALGFGVALLAVTFGGSIGAFMGFVEYYGWGFWRH